MKQPSVRLTKEELDLKISSVRWLDLARRNLTSSYLRPVLIAAQIKPLRWWDNGYKSSTRHFCLIDNKLYSICTNRPLIHPSLPNSKETCVSNVSKMAAGLNVSVFSVFPCKRRPWDEAAICPSPLSNTWNILQRCCNSKWRITTDKKKKRRTDDEWRAEATTLKTPGSEREAFRFTF